MRAVACVCVIACCLGLTGCSLFGKKAQTKQNDPAPNNSPGGWLPPPDNSSPPVVERTGASTGGAILAGQVRDSYDRAPPATFIQVIAVRDINNARGAPIEVAADNQGYFTILDLKAGENYLLIARTRDGQARMAGQVMVKAPNPRILIPMSSDFVTPNTPPAPGPPALPGQKNGSGSASNETSQPSSISGPGGVDLGPPVRIGDPSANPGRAEVRPEDIAVDPNGLARRDIQMTIPSPGAPAQPRASEGTASSAPLRVPSCVLTGKQLHNFALYDLDMRPWEYRNHQGKLVLLDFWGSWCIPCLQAIPHLRILQEQYGSSGLEVIGIDYEKSGTFQEQLHRVQAIRERLKINYLVLKGGDMNSCPVRTQFGVIRFPTLILLDENNRIIWREEGLDEIKLQDLTTLIKWRLRAQ